MTGRNAADALLPSWISLAGASAAPLRGAVQQVQPARACTNIQRSVPLIPEGSHEAFRLSGEANDSEEPTTSLNGMPVPASTCRVLFFRRKTKLNRSAPSGSCLRRNGSRPERETGRCEPISAPTWNGFPKESILCRATKGLPEVPPARRRSRRSIVKSMSTPEHPGVDVGTSPG
jgi:hypothetical protein